MRKAKRVGEEVKADSKSLSERPLSIDKKNEEMTEIYAGSEEVMLNLVVEIIVKIIKKEVL
ncbi:hypothetical protein WG904_17720 [Pedobacter sp. Du54]|uniref:hypothetical protein n=1 Tax=Pedobacter anseongensis TaxID=3133439 RepID=UPI0030960D82